MDLHFVGVALSNANSSNVVIQAMAQGSIIEASGRDYVRNTNACVIDHSISSESTAVERIVRKSFPRKKVRTITLLAARWLQFVAEVRKTALQLDFGAAAAAMRRINATR
jgi:hypothetical protein